MPRAEHENGRIKIFRDFFLPKDEAKIMLEELEKAIEECPDSPQQILYEFLDTIHLNCDPKIAAQEILQELKSNGYELNVQNSEVTK